MADNGADVAGEFRSLVEKAERKFARVRDIPPYGPGSSPARYQHKVFKAYMKLWKYQQTNRVGLVESGLQRWEIGEIASRIGQLYFGQYQRTSEARFLLGACLFYEAILRRGYFDGVKMKDVGVRLKELRYYARFLVVGLILSREDLVRVVIDQFKALVVDCNVSIPGNAFKEWKQVVQEVVRFANTDNLFPISRPLRYCIKFDTHPDSLPYVARFHAKKALKLRDAVLTSYHRNEVKFAELTLDTYRMLQCIEWEPSGSSYQRHQYEPVNGVFKNDSVASGVIDINLVADLTDPNLPPNPRKAVLYRTTLTNLIAAISTKCEELPPESIMLIYVSSSGTAAGSTSAESAGGSRRFSRHKIMHSTSNNWNSLPEVHDSTQECSNGLYGSSLWLGSRGVAGSNNLYPGDLLPFTRRPLFLVVDSDNSHAFKAGYSWSRTGRAICTLTFTFKAFIYKPLYSGCDSTW